MFTRQLLEGNDIRKIRHRSSRECALHEFQPDWEGRARAGLPLAERNLFVVEAHPHARRDLRREPHKPRVGIILRGPSFSRGGAPQSFRLHAGTELNHFLEHRRHRARHFRGKHIVHFRMRLLEQRAIVAGHAPDHVGIDPDAVIRKHGEG